MYFFSVFIIGNISHLLLSLCQIRISNERLPPPNNLLYAYINFLYRRRAKIVNIIYPWVAIQCIRLTSNRLWNENVCNLKTLVYICIS